jgi:drug/metabolite transporter (DMT)-like permease
MRSIRDLNSQATRLTMLGLIVGAVLISFSGVWVKVAHVSPNASAFYRVFFGSIVLLAAALYHREVKWPELRHLLLSVLCGIHIVASQVAGGSDGCAPFFCAAAGFA